jgi:hypothetical protein
VDSAAAGHAADSAAAGSAADSTANLNSQHGAVEIAAAVVGTVVVEPKTAAESAAKALKPAFTPVRVNLDHLATAD